MNIEMDIQHHFAGGIYAKQVLIPAGHYAVQHKHKYEHLSLLASGTAIISTPGISMEMTGPQVVTIPAGRYHKVTAITDCIWFCIHATEETDPLKVDEVLIVASDVNEMRRIAEET